MQVSMNQLQNMLAAKIVKAQQKCRTCKLSPACIVAWDEVEELSVALHKRRDNLKHVESASFDRYCYLYPETKECKLLETFCDKFPYAEECRTYDV